MNINELLLSSSLNHVHKNCYTPISIRISQGEKSSFNCDTQKSVWTEFVNGNRDLVNRPFASFELNYHIRPGVRVLCKQNRS